LAQHGVVAVGVALAGRPGIGDCGGWAVVVGVGIGCYIPIRVGDQLGGLFVGLTLRLVYCAEFGGRHHGVLWPRLCRLLGCLGSVLAAVVTDHSGGRV